MDFPRPFTLMKGWALEREEYGDNVVYKLSVIDVKTTLCFLPKIFYMNVAV